VRNGARCAFFVLILGLALGACGGRTPPFDDSLGDGGSPSPADGAADAPRGDGSSQHDGAPAQSDGPPPLQSDAGPPVGVIPCGIESCNAASQECCATRSNGSSCIDKGTQCQGSTLTCAGPQDCQSSAPVCCAVPSGASRGVSCTTRQACQDLVVCRGSADCPGGQQCCGSGDVRGVTVTYCDDPANCSPTDVGIACGSQTCAPPGEVCCVTSAGPSCTAPNGCQGARLACSGPQDCSGTTPVCCGTLNGGSSSGTTCVATGACGNTTTGGSVVCQSSGDCPNTQTCQPLNVAGLSLGICR
jgi:hypothetical protein